MQQITGTLVSLATYLALVAVGAFLGFRPVLRSRTLPWLGRFQTAALLLLIFTLGAELGANEEIVASLGVIGLNAFLITAAAMAGSLLAVHILRKYILKLDKHGQPAGSAQTQEKHGEKVKVDHTLTLLIVFTVALGMVLGHFVLPDALAVHCGQIIQLGLYLLLFLVGLDLGRQEGMLSSVRQAGLRVVLAPACGHGRHLYGDRLGRAAAPPWSQGLCGRRGRLWVVLPGPHPAGPLLPHRIGHRLSLQRPA